MGAQYDLVIRGGTVIDGSGGAPFVADPGTRLLLTRVVSADTAQLSMWHRLTGDQTVGGLPTSVDLETAGDLLDRYLTQPSAPQENL